jgi:hypothetical protein
MTRDQWQNAAAEEDAARNANIELLQRLDAAAAEPGFSGQLRRAILSAKLRPSELASQVGVDREALQQFRLGEGTLPTDAFDRLMEVLGLAIAPAITGRS